MRVLLAEGRLPQCWVPPTQILECRALLETYHDLPREHTAQAQLCGVLPPGHLLITARRAADLGGLCLVDDYRLRRADEVALRASVVQIWPM